jgi:hypothetical protein
LGFATKIAVMLLAAWAAWQKCCAWLISMDNATTLAELEAAP